MKEIGSDKNKGIIIREISDCDEIHRVLLEMSGEYTPPLNSSINNLAEYACKLAHNAEVFIAKDDSLLGFIAFYSNDTINKIGYITQIGVKNKARSNGIGKKLINSSYSRCKVNGMENVKLEVRKNNNKAISFYQKEGFITCGKATDNSIYMEKSLYETR